MRDPAQQLKLRPAALEAAIPQPRVIRGEQRHPPLAGMRQHQQRLVLGALHHHLAGGIGQLDLAQPAAPVLGPGLALGRWRALEPRGHRMAQAKLGRARQIGLGQHPPGRPRRHDLSKRRLPQALDGGEFWPGRDQHRAAAFDVIADIGEIGGRQDAALAVAVEDDQIELVDLVDEQLLRREGDQRQFRHRHAVLLLGRAQDGEMHEIDARIGFQQVAPGALARVRLARDEQHPQPVAHAVDLHHRGVVARGQLARHRGKAELHNVLPAVFKRQRQFQILPDLDAIAARLAAVDRDGQIGLGPRGFRHRALVEHLEPDPRLLADDAEGGGGLDQQPPVPVFRMAGQHQLQRRGQRGGKVRVMRLPVGDDDGAGDAGARLGRQRLGERRTDLGAGVLRAVGHGDPAQLGVGQGLHLGRKARHRRIGLRRTVGQRLRGGAVVNQQHDVRERRALLALQRGLRKRAQKGERCQRAQRPAPQPAPQRQRQQQRRQPRAGGDHRPGQQRREDHRKPAHCPSLSSKAGTCTWSDL